MMDTNVVMRGIWTMAGDWSKSCSGNIMVSAWYESIMFLIPVAYSPVARMARRKGASYSVDIDLDFVGFEFKSDNTPVLLMGLSRMRRCQLVEFSGLMEDLILESHRHRVVLVYRLDLFICTWMEWCLVKKLKLCSDSAFFRLSSPMFKLSIDSSFLQTLLVSITWNF